jgi:hypothetical protein
MTAVRKKNTVNWISTFRKSKISLLHSAFLYYSSGVLGKTKYLQILKNSKRALHQGIRPQLYVPYKRLSKFFSEIDIGDVIDIHPALDQGCTNEEMSLEGCFRNLISFVVRLAQLYLKLNKTRKDKLLNFKSLPKKDPSSTLFAMAIGGDGAPGIGGTAFLISFLNIGKRRQSSYEQYMLFGANCHEDSTIVTNFVKQMISDVKYLESKIFKVDVDGNDHKVEFKLTELPNDMKMLAYLAGETTNSSMYFTTFANVSKDDRCDITKTFGVDKNDAGEWLHHWHPWDYETRCKNALQVKQVKQQQMSKNTKPATKRAAVMHLISKTQKSRQEFVPRVEHFIDAAKCEPLHLKNNTVRDLFARMMGIILENCHCDDNVKVYAQLPPTNLFVAFVSIIKSIGCNQLSRHMIDNYTRSWHNNVSLTYRFVGSDSKRVLCMFPSLMHQIYNLIPKAQKKITHLHKCLLLLREIISLTTRTLPFTTEDLNKLQCACKELYNMQVIQYDDITPSMWVLCKIAPLHAKRTLEAYQGGLGLVSMESAEQKHQSISKYASNTICHSNKRWQMIFRHEFIHLIYLRENGADQNIYKTKGHRYLPIATIGHCLQCGFKGECILCHQSDTGLAK